MNSRLELRAPFREDLELFFEFQRDPVAIKMAGFRPRSLEAFMEHWGKILVDPKVMKTTIVWDGRVAGNIVCFDVDEKRTVGYWLGSDYWGKGIATDALKQFVRGCRKGLCTLTWRHIITPRAGSWKNADSPCKAV